ncbi:GIY-YIG nuclease family protein [Chitinophaga defluvii]|uniref:GIY-YIG nuclease family protein n=1 Tax=Chitinophaga defluvii TaxID=3163343 RepID=A0ABV2SYU7_9BACT
MKSRKELKQIFREMVFKMGVYQIRNITSNKVFIGSSTDLERAWNGQRVRLDNGIHLNKALQKEWREQGASQFVYEIVEELKDTADPATDYKTEVKILEEMVIAALQPFGDKGYH